MYANGSSLLLKSLYKDAILKVHSYLNWLSFNSMAKSRALFNNAKDLLNILGGLQLLNKKITILVGKLEEALWLSVRNIKHITILQAEDASTYDLIDCEMLLLDKLGIELLDKQLS